MERLVRKYSIVIVILSSVSGMCSFILIFLLTHPESYSNKIAGFISNDYLISTVNFLLNIVLFVIISKEMRALEIKSYIIRLTTLLIGWLGVSLFLLTILEKSKHNDIG